MKNLKIVSTASIIWIHSNDFISPFYLNDYIILLSKFFDFISRNQVKDGTSL